MNEVQVKKFMSSLKKIEKNLESIAVDTKALKDIEHTKRLNEQSYTTLDLIKDSALTFILGIVVGYMLSECGILNVL
ncbi:hypothetical protein MX629_08390 [Carnobacterium divergens]|uniref:Uncharacterized protein n=1 Tax=Carnobacterium divergens TaxID=2748 RepID=A0AAW8R9U0_CARDV|nr:hypothetical protein [Carnobacterium divergens]MDT1958437.1 hypothetical protein [Carnobacterium divergens]MDT1974405.1 hypothetical protein [Carnobacterium divergens]